MSSAVTSRRFLTAVLACAALTCAAARAAADESFTLNIPTRPGDLPAARVKVTLELSAAVGVWSVDVDGVNTAAPGFLDLPNGDRVRVTLGPGNTSVVLDYTVKGKFCPNDLCHFVGDPGVPGCPAGGNADVARSAPVKFTGPNITGYRVNTYVAPAPDFFCGVASKRVGTPNASLTSASHGGLPALVADDKGRHPLDLVLVLDQSGSMNSRPPGGNPGDPSKWSILVSSLTTLINQWKALDEPDGVEEWSRDRIGMVFFSSTANPAAIAGAEEAGFFKPRGTDLPGPQHDWNDVISAIPAAPGGSTALGKGVVVGMDKWEEAAAAQKNDSVFIVMTDGMQNVAPLITTAPNSVLSVTPDMAGKDPIIYKHAIPMQGIAFGVPATTEQTLLDNLSQQTAGFAYMALDAAGLGAGMADSLLNSLKGDTASLAIRRQNTAAGPGPWGPFPVTVDQSVRRVMFTVQWAPPLVGVLDLQVFPPGTTPTPTGTGATPTRRIDSAQSTILTFNVTPALLGTWQVRVVRKPQVPFAAAVVNQPSQGSNVPYTLSAHFLEQRLDFTMSFLGVGQGTGDQIGIRAQIGYDDQPLTGLPPNAVRVEIARPGESLGTLLNTMDTASAPDPTPADTTPPHAQKTDQLTKEQLASINPQPVSTISLAHRGNGLYEGSFAGTSEVGLYRFQVVLDWNDPRTGQLHREERLEREVKLTPSPSSTTVTTTASGSGQFTVAVTPQDRFGNFLGPGFGHLVKATLNGPGTITGPLDPQVKGIYQFTVTGVPPGTTPDVDVSVGGVAVGGTFSGGRFRLFFDIGANFPQGTFNTSADGGVSVNGGFEYFLMPATSVEGIIGYHGFSGSESNGHIWQYSGNLKQYLGPGPLRAFVNAGAGAYHLEPGATTHGGFNVGGGVIFQVNPRVAIEGVYNFHSVSTPTNATQFSTLQAGIRVRIP